MSQGSLTLGPAQTELEQTQSSSIVKPHPRQLGWIGTAAVAIGGSNQSLFLIGALLIGQGTIPGQGSAAIPLLIVGLLLSWAAAPGWIELILMYPNRVGGIAATCTEAFMPYSPVLANLTGVCYWWGWVPTCGLTAILSASVINQWYLPWFPVTYLATLIVIIFAMINLCGIHWATRVAVVIASVSASLAFLSGLIPIVTGHVNWVQATTFHLNTPFPGYFGEITSLMAGLYLIGFAAPAFEQATCHVGETINPEKNVPRAVYAAGLMAGIYFILLPLVWLGVIGSDAMSKDLAVELGPTFAPLFGDFAKSAAIWFMMFNMFHGTLAPLAGATRTMSQLADDGLVPKILGYRNKNDAPWISTLLMAFMAIAFLIAGDPVWLIAAANLTYLIGICMPNVAVWLLRKDQPKQKRPYRAPTGTIILGVVAAFIWGISTILGFQQFGLPTVLAGIAFAYAGAGLYAWRIFNDRREAGLPGIARTLNVKLTGAMLLVLILDAAGYLIAVNSVPEQHSALIAGLEDIFVVVALLTISVGLILPGMIANSVTAVSEAANKLAKGTIADFSKAMQALGKGNLEAAYARIDITPVECRSRDEVGDMALNFNTLQEEIKKAAIGLDGAREGLRTAHDQLKESNTNLKELNETLEQRVLERTQELEREVNERKRAEMLIAEQEFRMRTILNSTVDAIVTTDKAGIIKSFNATAEKFFDFKANEIVGHPIYTLIPTLSVKKFTELFSTKVENDNFLAKEHESKGQRKDGSTFSIAYRLSETTYVQEDLKIILIQDITERKQAEKELKTLNQKLIDTARKAGMAEVATSVLHNVGNVLNSVNVSSNLITEKLSRSELKSFSKLSELMNKPIDDLITYISKDPKGQQLPRYFTTLVSYWDSERGEILVELDLLNKNVQHIKDIISRQQSLSGVSGLQEQVLLPDLIEDAILITTTENERQKLKIHRQFDELNEIIIDKSKTLQILINLIRNAKESLLLSHKDNKELKVQVLKQNDGIRIEVADNGEGIHQENITKIFSYGFTTKKDGHGFGLHACALSAKEMGGSLVAESKGPEQGATFILDLPYGSMNRYKD